MNNTIQRTKNAKRNIVFGFINKIITLFLPFLIRVVIINKFSSEYLGLGSLFTSILQVLNITELGFSNAVVYAMYEPVAKNDISSLCALLRFYKKIYSIIGIIIAIIGFSLLPVLPKLIKGSYPSEVNIYILYIIYLTSTVVSYVLFSYKNSLLLAYQRNDVISNLNTIVTLSIYLLQIIIIIYTKNYYLYTLTIFISSLILNIFTFAITNKLFPDIKCKGNISKNDKEKIKQKVKGLFIDKLCGVSRNSFDSIFISAFLGLTITAIYSNYYYIMQAVVALLGIIPPSILAGVGNSIVIESIEKNYTDMKKINFLYMWLTGWCTVCLSCLYQPFIQIVFGNNMLFSYGVVILFCIYFYVREMGNIRSVYSDAVGLWWENRYRALIETGANIILNYILGKKFGIYGIISATLISLFFINFIWGSNIIYKYYFKKIKIFEYYLLSFLYMIVTLGACLLSYYFCSKIQMNNIIGLVLKFIICTLISNTVFYLIYRKTKLFNISINWVLSFLNGHEK